MLDNMRKNIWSKQGLKTRNILASQCIENIIINNAETWIKDLGHQSRHMNAERIIFL